MQREAIIRGPAIVGWNSLIFYSKDDIKVSLIQEAFDVESSAFGKVDERVKNRLAKISFTPAGKWITGLWPYAATAFGASIFGATDKDLVIKPLDTNQNQWTFYNAAITRLPDIYLSATKTLIGEVEFTALGKENTLPGTADSLVKREANTFNDTSFVAGDLVVQPYTASWGAISGWTNIETVNGWTVSFGLKLDNVESDTYGLIDMTLGGLDVTAKCEPLTVTEADLLAQLAVHKAIGASLGSGTDLTISGTGVTVVVKNAVIKQADPVWGLKANRIGPVTFTAQRKFVSGVVQPLFSVA